MVQLQTRPARLATYFLGLALLMQVLGEGFTIFRYGSALTTSLWQQGGLSDSLAWQLDWYAYLLLVIVAAGWGLWRRQAWCLYLCAIWLLVLTLIEYYQAGSFGASYSLFAHALRFATPAALGLLMEQQRASRQRAAIVLLCFASAAVFAAHGLEAWHANPEFLDFIIRICRDYAALTIKESDARTLLTLIACQDFALALSVLVSPRRRLFYYMSAWGFLTAGARLLFSPAYGLPLMLVRMTNSAAPLALALWAASPKADRKPLLF